MPPLNLLLLSWALTSSARAWVAPRAQQHRNPPKSRDHLPIPTAAGGPLTRTSSSSSSSTSSSLSAAASSRRSSYQINSITTAGLAHDEVSVLLQTIDELATSSTSSPHFPSLDDDSDDDSVRIRTITDRAAPDSVPGTTGRVVVVGVRAVTNDDDEDEDEDEDEAEQDEIAQEDEDDALVDFQIALSRRWDDYLYSGSIEGVTQPFLLFVDRSSSDPSSEGRFADRADDSAVRANLQTLVEDLIAEYGLRVPLPKFAAAADAAADGGDANADKATPPPPPPPDPSATIPTLEYEVDGATVTDASLSSDSSGGVTFFDTSSVFAFDGLISNDLRRRLFNVVNGYDESNEDPRALWDDVTMGPDPRRWVRGGLVDTLDLDSDGDGDGAQQSSPSSSEPTASSSSSVGGDNFGLTVEATNDLCYNHHDALHELECILSSLFPSVTLSRLDGNVLGESYVSSLTANAPVYGDAYQPHIDADPALLPPSPWTDAYGRYPNRSPGKPRFMSCLVYLNDEWRYEEWGGSTRIWDVATDTSVDIEPRPGRIVMMDQDVTHSVVAPREGAGRRPRYSLVWKLILHPNPNHHGDGRGQDMKESIRQPTWPRATAIGSAAAEGQASDEWLGIPSS